MAEAKKRKGTALLAVMNENCSSCAGSPLCEAHCPVDGCINILYEELPQGGLKPYRVFVDNDKCIGCQMCYSDDLTKIQQHKDTGEVFYEYNNRFFDRNRKPIDPDAVPKRIQLQLIGTQEGNVAAADRKYDVAAYSLSGGELIVSLLNSDLVSTKLNSTAELQEAFKDHAGDPQLFKLFGRFKNAAAEK